MYDQSKIKEHMDVFGSCGNRLGQVDRIEGNSIKLTKDNSGQHHYIPADWVNKVDQSVHLGKDCGAAKKEWSTNPAPAGV